MKKTILITIMAFVCFGKTALSQEQSKSIMPLSIDSETHQTTPLVDLDGWGITPIVQEGRQWVYEMNYNDLDQGRRSIAMVFEFKGDTVINDMECKKLYRTFKESGTAVGKPLRLPESSRFEFDTTPMLVACCLERATTYGDVSVVTELWVSYSDEYCSQMWNYAAATVPNYMEPYDAETKWYCVYQELFDKNYLGEIHAELNYRLTPLLQQELEHAFTFPVCETVEINGVKRNKFSTSHVNYPNCFIEGIGNIGFQHFTDQGHGNNFISPLAIFRNCEAKTYLNHVVENGNIVYKGPFFKDELVEKMVSINDLTVDDTSGDDAYYNLQGQRVDNPSAGIYIHGGKKVVVK